MSSVASGIKRFIMWDFPRAGWQYDVMVGLILLFIFLTPRGWFRDQPKPSSIVMLPAEHGTGVFWIEPKLLATVPADQQSARAATLIKARTGKRPNIARLETIADAEHDIKGYMVFTTP